MNTPTPCLWKGKTELSDNCPACNTRLTPLTDKELRKIIEDQSCLTGWKVPPTKQVARAVERAHGIGTEDAHQPFAE